MREKGFYIVDAGEDGVKGEFVPVPGPRFEVVKADLTGVQDFEQALSLYEQALSPFPPATRCAWY